MRATDRARFDDFVAARYDSLCRSAYVLCGDVHHAEDLVQTVFLRLHRSWARAQRADDLDAYVYVMLANAHRSWRSRRWHGEAPSEALPDAAQDVPAEEVVDDRDRLVRALRGLGRDHREVLVLRFIAGLSEERTAAALNVTVGTVKSRTSRALAAIRAGAHFDDKAKSQ
jgi:RNA polymerase sigma-70 factor (ECF subfamily)